MALVVKDRVKETTTTTGTGAVTLAGAVAGFQAFSGVLSDSDTTYYSIVHRDTAEFEVGLGTYSSSTLTRTTVLESSNSGNAVNFTAGTKDIFITYPAEKSVYLDASDVLAVGNINTSGYLRGPSTFTIDPAAHGDDTGTLVVAGNLQVDGTTTTINSTTVTIDDKNLVLASGAANAAAANGAGLTIDGASATFTYNATTDRWVMNKDLESNVVGNVTGQVSDISNHSTTGLAEGTNLYYTTARVNGDIDTRVTKGFVDALNVDADTLDGLDSTDFDPAGSAVALAIALG